MEDVSKACASLGLVLGDRLGKGSRATVFSAVGVASPGGAALDGDSDQRSWRAAPGQAVAVKALLDDIPATTLAELASEAELWGALRHDGIVRLLHASLAPAPLLVLEACDGGTLFAALRRGDALDVRSIAMDVANALAAVHAAGQAHRDVKSANVLLTRDSSGRVVAKLCDWGSAAPISASLPARPLPPAWPSALFGGGGGSGSASPVTWTPVGTLLWMAPEMLDPHLEGSPPPRGASGATADVYSFGILLWELLERRLPWVEPVKVKRAEVLRVVVKEGKRLPISKWVTKEVCDGPCKHACMSLWRLKRAAPLHVHSSLTSCASAGRRTLRSAPPWLRHAALLLTSLLRACESNRLTRALRLHIRTRSRWSRVWTRLKRGTRTADWTSWPGRARALHPRLQQLCRAAV